MEQSRLVEVDLHSRLQHLGDVGERGEAQYLRVGPLGYHHPHVDLGQRCRLQRLGQTVGGQEVGSLYVDRLFSVGNGFQEEHGNVGPLAYGSTRRNLDTALSPIFYRREEVRRRQHLFALETPVDGKEQLQSLHGRPLDAQMRVAPDAPLEPLDVAVGDVHAADIADAAVDDGYLAVVAVVDAAGQLGEGYLEEGTHDDAGLLHLLEKTLLDRPAPHVVVEHPYLYPPAGTSQQHLFHAGTQLVVFEDIVLYVYVLAGCLQVLQILVELALPRGEDLHPVARVVGHAAQAVTELDLLLALLVQRQLVDIDNRVVVALAQFALDASRHHALGLEILSEKDIKDQPHHGKESEHDDPRQTLYRVTIFGDDNHNRSQYGDGIYRIDYEIDPVGKGHQGECKHK